MVLSIGLARAIVDAVKADPKCEATIRSSIGNMVPASLRLAGSIRNAGLVLSDGVFRGYFIQNAAGVRSLDTDGAVSRDNEIYLCYGIAEITAHAIERASGRAYPGSTLGSIRRSDIVTRQRPVTHAATRIILMNGNEYVFDWHGTLRIDDPTIFPSVEDFEVGGHHAVLFSKFTGFS